MHEDVEEIVKQVLRECQKILKDSNELVHCIDEVPPHQAIVKFHDGYNKNGFNIGNTIKEWNISLNNIKENIDLIKAEKYIQCEVKKNYFGVGKFYFSIAGDLQKVVLEYFFGPMYAMGYIYDIIKEDKTKQIKNKKMLWLS